MTDESEYALREKDRRFAVYLNNILHTETRDRDHARVVRDIHLDSHDVTIRVFTGNQEADESIARKVD